VRAVVAVLALALAFATAGAATRSASGQDASVFAGLGTWVDIYDTALYASPARTAQRMSDRGVQVAWVETANYGARTDVVDPVRLGRLVDALHARGIRVVAWYLPGHLNQARDVRRANAMLTFRTPTGATFDGVALNVEATKLRNAKLRSQRAVSLARTFRAAAGATPVAMVPIDPRALERRPSRWPRFPYAALAEQADAFAPMIYTGGAFRGFEANYGYVTRSLRLLRTHTANPDLPIHVAGGVANRMRSDDLAGFVAAVEDDGATLGVSLYDWQTTPSSAWRAVARLSQ
jgi:hypothetical protein